MEKPPDIREEIFQECLKCRVTGSLIAEASGVVSGMKRAKAISASLGLSSLSELRDGSSIEPGQRIVSVVGNPVQIAMAEEKIIGAFSKTSGIATAARQARFRAGRDLKVVSGGWKKMPSEIKGMIRQAARDGGIETRISKEAFVYLDKNYVRILGGIKEAIHAAAPLSRGIVVQVRGETAAVEEEAVNAAEAGAAVVMVDTGRRDQLSSVIASLKERDLRSRVQVAFAGNLEIEELNALAHLDLDIVDIGYAILDAPCLPMRFDVIEIV